MNTRAARIFLLGAGFALISQSCFAQTITLAPDGPADLKADGPARTDVTSLMEAAITLIQARDLDGAGDKLDIALKADPGNKAAHFLRATVYNAKRLFPQAEAELMAADKIDGTDLQIKYALAVVKFSQKQYDVARVRFFELEKKQDLQDLAAYNVFLCDLVGEQKDAAKKEFDAFNLAGTNPSYYFGNVAWSLYHKDLKQGKSWLESASHIYPLEKMAPYAQPLRNLGYLPIPRFIE